MNLQVGVKILIKDNEGRYLMLLRSKEKYPEIGEKWDILGGRIDVGFSLFENLKREVKEESGLELVGTPELISAQDIIKEDKHVVRLTYVGEASGDITLSEEHSEYRYFTIDEIKNLDNCDSYVRKIIDKLK